MKYKFDNLIFKQDEIGNIRISQNHLKHWLLLIAFVALSLIVFIVGASLMGNISFLVSIRCWGVLGVIFFPYLVYVYITQFHQDFTSNPPSFISILPPAVQIGRSQYYSQHELSHINLRRETISNPKASPFISGNPFIYTQESAQASLKSAFWESDVYYYATLHLQNKQEIPLFQTQGHKQGDLASYLAEWIADTLKIPFTQVN